MVTTLVESRSSVTAHRLRYVVSFFGGGLGLSVLYAATGAGLPCPFRTFTGWECPLCGGTRMGGALLHGDVSAAFAFNPVALIGLVVLGLFGLAWVVELAGGPRVRGPLAVRRRLATVRPMQWVVLGVAAASSTPCCATCSSRADVAAPAPCTTSRHGHARPLASSGLPTYGIYI